MEPKEGNIKKARNCMLFVCNFEILRISVGEVDGSKVPLLSSAIRHNDSITHVCCRGMQNVVNEIEEFAETLGTLGNLQVVSFRNVIFKESGVLKLVESLSRLPYLTTLELIQNNIERQGYRHFSQLLEATPSLSKLIISRNSLGGEESVPEFFDYIRTRPSLSVLNLTEMYMGKGNARTLAPIVSKSKSLVCLCLGYNKLGDDGVRYIGEAIAEAERLEVVRLDENMVGHMGLDHLTQGVVKSHSIASLSLDSNIIGGTGAKYLIAMLKAVQLKRLSVNSNKLDDEGLRDIVENAVIYCNLQELSLYGNTFDRQLKAHLNAKAKGKIPSFYI